MTIRLAEISDASAISDLILRASETVRDQDFTDQGWALLENGNTVEAIKKRLDIENYFAMVYELNAKVVAYIAIADYQKIDHLFVLDNHRRLGIAKKLWEAALFICEAQSNAGYFWVRSSTFAEPVYASFGFRVSGDRQSLNGISFRLMEKGAKQQECVGPYSDK